MLSIEKIYHISFFAKLFHTVVNELQNELADSESVLDLGCGPNSPIQHVQNIKYSVGVEIFEPYLKAATNKKIHTKYIQKDIMQVDFEPKSFDAVIMVEVLEHLTPKDGHELLKKAEYWAKKKIIVTSPNGFINQKEVDRNPYQKHLSGWDYKKMHSLGFTSRGLAGLKILRREVQDDTMGDNLLTSIKLRPKLFWFIVATLSQIICYYMPNYAFELFSVKKLDPKVNDG